jgi:hypothetical protein
MMEREDTVIANGGGHDLLDLGGAEREEFTRAARSEKGEPDGAVSADHHTWLLSNPRPFRASL